MDEVHAHLDIDFKSLDCVVAQIDLDRNCGVVSLKDWQQAQCRLFLSEVKGILVCPDPSFLEEIRIVAHRELIRNRTLDSMLRESNIKLKDYSIQLTPALLQEALQFSLIARLSPHWKAVVKSETNGGDLLVNGSQFSNSSNSPADAVKLRVFAKGCEMWVGICAYRLRLPFVRPEYLDISFSYIEKLLACSGRSIGESKIGNPSVYVLPSLKKGKVTLLTNGLPSECEFQNYLHVQGHWKNTFGLLLPKAESGKPLLFADVRLEGSNRSYIYPLQCLLRTHPVILKHIDPWTLVQSVLKRIKALVPILFLEINGNHFLAANPKLRDKPDIVEECFQEETNSDTMSNYSTQAEFPNAPSQKREKSAIQNGSCRYRLSLKRPLNVAPTSEGQFSGSETSPNPTKHSKSPVRATALGRLSLSHGEHTKRKLVPSATDNSSNVALMTSQPNQPKKKNVYGRALKPHETVEGLFKDGALEEVHRKELIKWLRERNIPRGTSRQKAVLLCKVRAALMNTCTTN